MQNIAWKIMQVLFVVALQRNYEPQSIDECDRGIFRGVGRVYLTCLLPLISLANPPLQVY